MPDYNALFKLDSSDKQFQMSIDDGRVVITNAELYSESFELSEILSSDNQIKFGQCNASSVKFKTANILTNLTGKILTITISINNNEPFTIGQYKVYSDKPTADKHYREIVAYDSMYDILNANVSAWYKAFFANNNNPTLKQFRDSFFAYVGVTQETVVLPQDEMIVEETIGGDDISGKLVITSICEINGCFGHIGRDNEFKYVYLFEISNNLFPSLTLYPSTTLYPSEIGNTTDIDSAYYYEATYEEYVSQRITKLQIRQNENDIGYVYGNGTNCYIVEDNFLVYGKSSAQLAVIAENMYEKINIVQYRPSTIKAKGNLTIDVGTSIFLKTEYKDVYTYVLERNLKGVQALIDNFSAEGTEYHEENVNSTNRSLYQLKGKTNELERNIEETRSTITDVEAGLQSEIRQTASAFETTLEAYSTTSQMNSAISQSANSILSTVSATYETNTASNSKYTELSSAITQTASNITAEVSRAQTAEEELAASISVNTDAINLKVSKGDVSSQISQEAGQITINSNRIAINSTNFKLTTDGKITASNGEFSGKITASSGTIGGFTIGSSSLYAGNGGSSIGGVGVHVGTDGLSCASAGASSVIKADGTAEFKTSGGVKIYSDSTHYSYVKPNGLTIKNSTYTDTTYTEKSINAYAAYTINAYNGLSLDVSNIGARTIDLKAGSLVYASFSSTNSYVYGNTKLSLGRNTSSFYLGFFGSSGSSKKTVANISSTSSASTSTIATKLNDLLTALRGYGLIG